MPEYIDPAPPEFDWDRMPRETLIQVSAQATHDADELGMKMAENLGALYRTVLMPTQLWGPDQIGVATLCLRKCIMDATASRINSHIDSGEQEADQE